MPDAAAQRRRLAHGQGDGWTPCGRVVITGMGAVSPLGLDVASSWAACREGVSGAGPITQFDSSALTVHIAAEVRGFDAAAAVGVKEARRTSRCTQLAIVATREAVAQSGLAIAPISEEVGVLVACGAGGLEVQEQVTRTYDGAGPRRVSPFAAAAMLVDMPAGMVAMDTGARGPNLAVVSACASGANALGEAAEWIRRGDARAVLAGGTEAAITATGMSTFAAARALSTRNHDPEGASRPFDAGRDGFLAAEGACVMVLEDRDLALARGAPILAELSGYGATADAHHMTEPDPAGDGAARAMRRALRRAGLDPGEVGYVNAHGTGTVLNDVTETLALHAVFGDGGGPPVSSTKSMTGHMLGAAGAFEALVCVLSLRDQFLPPTINLDDPDPRCQLDHVAHHGRAVTGLRHALTASYGFGGHNACLVISAADVAP
ncbi:MAG: beta-ketoacyl-ACP synthase II [Candidatus Dormibacteria bacterium]